MMEILVYSPIIFIIALLTFIGFRNKQLLKNEALAKLKTTLKKAGARRIEIKINAWQDLSSRSKREKVIK